MEDLEDFNDIMVGLDQHLKDRVKVMMTNYSVPGERVAAIYRTYEYNLGNEKRNDSIPMENLIIQKIEEKLEIEKAPQKNPKTSGYRKSTNDN